MGEAQEEVPEDTESHAPLRRILYHGRMRVPAKKRRLSRQAIAPPPLLTLPAPPVSAQEGQADQSHEETEPEERIPASPEAEDVDENSFELHFVPAPARPYRGPEQFGYLDE